MWQRPTGSPVHVASAEVASREAGGEPWRALGQPGVLLPHQGSGLTQSKAGPSVTAQPRVRSQPSAVSAQKLRVRNSTATPQPYLTVTLSTVPDTSLSLRPSPPHTFPQSGAPNVSAASALPHVLQGLGQVP